MRIVFSAIALAGILGSWTSLHAQQQFEQPGYYPANVLAPSVPLRGDQYTIRDKAYDDGLTATFWVDSNTGETYKATGMPQLYQRIAEIYAIAKLRQMDSSKEYSDSLGKGASNTVTAVGKTLSDPGNFFKSIPQGASKFFGSLGENMKGGKSQYEGQAYSNVLGQSKAKRMLAFQLGVNPYSTNETLQKELNRVGWSQAGGSITVQLAVGRHTRGGRHRPEHEPHPAEFRHQPRPRAAQHHEPEAFREHWHRRRRSERTLEAQVVFARPSHRDHRCARLARGRPRAGGFPSTSSPAPAARSMRTISSRPRS